MRSKQKKHQWIEDSYKRVQEIQKVSPPLQSPAELQRVFNESKAFREEAERALAIRGDITVIAIDECKEVSPEVFEQLRSHPSLQDFISTEKDNNWLRYIKDNTDE